MKAQTKTLALSALMAGSLLLSSVPASAYDDYRFRRERWKNRNDRSELYRQLQAARQKLNYDSAHHKSRKQIARDEDRVRDLENQLRGAGWNSRRSWWD